MAFDAEKALLWIIRLINQTKTIENKLHMGAVSQKILKLRFTLRTSSSSWKNTTSAIVSQQTIVTTTISHSHSLVMFKITRNHKIMIFVKRIFAPDICLRLRSLLRFFCETGPWILLTYL